MDRNLFPAKATRATAAIAVLLVVAAAGCCFFEAHDHGAANLCLNVIAASFVATWLLALSPIGRAMFIGRPLALSAVQSVLVPPPKLV